MSLNTLLESANPYHSMQSDAAKLASKWEKTGLLEGLQGANKSNMGIILENQAKQLVVEESNTHTDARRGNHGNIVRQSIDEILVGENNHIGRCFIGQNRNQQEGQ